MKRSALGVFSLQPPDPLPCDARDVIEILSPLALPERVARIDHAVAGRIDSVIAVVEGLADPHNASAILRTCDGLGIHEVHVIEPDARVLITTQVTKGCEKWMALRRHHSARECVEHLHSRGFTVLVADMRASEMWTLERAATEPRIAVVFGNEHAGVSEAVREAADGAIAVPMRGMVESFNVSVAAAIALFAIARSRPAGLAEGDALELKARFLMESVRESHRVIEHHLHLRERARVQSEVRS